MKKVVVTGIGAVTPLGNSFRESWNNLLQGTSGISKIERFDVSDIPYQFAGQIRDLEVSKHLTSRETFHSDLFTQYALISAIEAIEDAQLSDKVHTNGMEETSIVMGTSRGGIASLETAWKKQNNGKYGMGGKRLSPYLMPSTTPSMPASVIAERFGFKGECLSVANACASGSIAIGNALRFVRTGLSQIVMVIGTEAPLCRICLEGYGASGALSKRADKSASRPFDKERNGFVLSEGACVLILEEYESARTRGAKIYGEIIGYGNSMDAFHVTRPAGEGEAKAIRQALKDASCEFDSIDFITAHATSTPLGDRVETEALWQVLGEYAATIPVSALKSMTGHMLAASGTFETAAAFMSIREGIIPPSININERDRNCRVNVVTQQQRADIRYGVVNSFGFGGINAVLVIRKLSG